jgi:hypothetical protein
MTNGYVIYPEGVGKSTLIGAYREAARQSKLPANSFQARIERVSTEKVVSRFRNGKADYSPREVQ